MQVTSKGPCVVCGHATHSVYAAWHAICPVCHYESGDLSLSINEAITSEVLDEASREIALKALRVDNFKKIVKDATRFVQTDASTLLDVGCAHGWFLEQSAPRFKVLGIEPDEVVGRRAAARGLPVRIGYFPAALNADERFDVIVFNDVFEHIPDIREALYACRERLNRNGILILNLPSSTGIFYRTSKLFAKFGWQGPLERMWQLGLPSPHLHYFSRTNLTKLVCSHGFEAVGSRTLPSVRSNGLLERIRCVGKVGKLTSFMQYLLVLCALPWLRILPSDIVVCTFRKGEAEAFTP